MSAEFNVESPIKSNHSSPFRFIVSHIMRHPIAGLLLVAGAFSNAYLAGVVPGAVGIAFSAIRLMNDETLRLVLNSVLLIIASQTLRSVLSFMRNFAAEVFAQRFERDIRDELYSSLLGKSMSYHDMQPVGETMARVTNDVREMNLMMNPGVNLITGANMFLIMPGALRPEYSSTIDLRADVIHRVTYSCADLFRCAIVSDRAGCPRQLRPYECEAGGIARWPGGGQGRCARAKRNTRLQPPGGSRTRSIYRSRRA